MSSHIYTFLLIKVTFLLDENIFLYSKPKSKNTALTRESGQYRRESVSNYFTTRFLMQHKVADFEHSTPVISLAFGGLLFLCQ